MLAISASRSQETRVAGSALEGIGVASDYVDRPCTPYSMSPPVIEIQTVLEVTLYGIPHGTQQAGDRQVDCAGS